MNRFRIGLALLVVLAVLSGCTGGLPAVDWCYRFDFRNSNYGFTVLFGTWQPGSGFRTDDDGRFKVNYVHEAVVTPSAVILTASRASAAQIPTSVMGMASVFGLTMRTVQTVVPAEVSTTDLYLTATQTGPGSSDKVEITGVADNAVYLSSLQVRGNGSNPFGISNCSTAAIAAADDGQPDVPIPDEITGSLLDADTDLASVDVPLTAPDGSPLLPALTFATTVFGHLKWITSGTAAEELAGPFAGLLSHMGIYLVMTFALTGIYFVIYGVMYIIRWAIWFWNTVLKLIATIAAVITAAPALAILLAIIAIGIVVAYLSGALDGVIVLIRGFLGG